MYETIVRLFDTSQFNAWIIDNALLSLCIAALIFITSYFFFPFLMAILLHLRHKRRVWQWWLLRGKKMSKRARNFELAEALDTLLADWVNKGKLTRREKRRYLINLEMAFELEPGDLTPRPNAHERKRRILSRLPADKANKFVNKMSASVQPAKRLINVLTGKA